MIYTAPAGAYLILKRASGSSPYQVHLYSITPPPKRQALFKTFLKKTRLKIVVTLVAVRFIRYNNFRK